MIRIPSRRELLLGLGVATLASTFVLIPGPAVADAAQDAAQDAAPGVVLEAGPSPF
ncbi:hypothetical protein GCM10011374_21570 [Kocuria dechangensis]|uniref:Uncharacterized protein n=1 Tax=Kocuria dechangensis TaxID=1176249 RepID=A0A917GVE3_9MICC|nr:hypothetical protein [Kocuria dechangensis]GGG58431.1 hypothetical protein GCM10011374_21570 [Kocuria dechangensis]